MKPPADLLLRNANVITLDQANPRAAAVAVKGDRILHVGSQEDATDLIGNDTRVVDCEGQTVIPGFNDAHCHPIALAASLLSVDCTPTAAGSIIELQARIRQRAAQTPKGEWIRATGYNEFYLGEKRHPNRWDLDEAAPNHPIKLTHRSAHACVLNSLAMKMLGICGDTPEPPGGIIDRDLNTGDPNGLLFEMNSAVERRMPPMSEAALEEGMRLANEKFLAHGITSLQDATWTDSLRRWQALIRFKDRQALLPRVSLMFGADEIEEFQARGLTTGSDLGSGLRLGAVKLVLQTATGHLSPPPPQLNELVYRAHQAGFQLAIHAIEENEVEAAITALEYALSQAPRREHRHRLEHCSVCPPHLVQRLRNTEAVVVTQPAFVYYNGERYLATVAPTDLKALYPIGSLVHSGLRVAASSDAPIVPPNPLVGIHAAVTRAAETGETLLPDQRVSALKALEMYTVDSAYASFEEGTKGTISATKLADMAVLSRDPTAVPPEELRDIEVQMTIVGGDLVWQR